MMGDELSNTRSAPIRGEPGGSIDTDSNRRAPRSWTVMLPAAMAGGMAWGIRGQYGHETGAMIAGWSIYVVIPVLLMTVAAVVFARSEAKTGSVRPCVRWSFSLTAWLYLGLNNAVFRFPWPWNSWKWRHPWPWSEWTGRTPNGIIFLACALGLTAAVLLAVPPIGDRQETRQTRSGPSA